MCKITKSIDELKDMSVEALLDIKVILDTQNEQLKLLKKYSNELERALYIKAIEFDAIKKDFERFKNG